MKELDTENANGIADDDDLLMKEVIGELGPVFPRRLPPRHPSEEIERVNF